MFELDVSLGDLGLLLALAVGLGCVAAYEPVIPFAAIPSVFGVEVLISLLDFLLRCGVREAEDGIVVDHVGALSIEELVLSVCCSNGNSASPMEIEGCCVVAISIRLLGCEITNK